MSGARLLIVDPSERDREGLRSYFDERGYICTGVAARADAHQKLAEVLYPVALVDVDAGGMGQGVTIAKLAREISPPTSVILLTDEPTFETAVRALRAGVADVVVKSPDQLPYLAQVIERLAKVQGDPELLEEVRGVLDESFKVMLGLSRKVYSHLSHANMPLEPQVLVVDGDSEMLRQLSELIGDKDWAVAAEMTGGAALDKGTSAPIHVIASRDELMDLRGSMVVRSIQAQRAEVLGVIYSAEGAGKLELVEQGSVVHHEPRFGGATHLVEVLDRVVGDLGSRAEERRFIQAFSADHRAFLRRYADLKLTIDRLLSR